MINLLGLFTVIVQIILFGVIGLVSIVAIAGVSRFSFMACAIVVSIIKKMILFGGGA